MDETSYKVDQVYDAGPTGCGELIMNLFMAMKKMTPAQIIKVVSYDPGTKEDIPAWCRLQGHTLLKHEESGKNNYFYIQKNE